MRRPRRDDGTSSVEFALVASFLLLPLLFGIVQYGFYFFQAAAAEHVAQTGARLASVGIDDCSAWEQDVMTRSAGLDVAALTVGPAGTGPDPDDLTRGSDLVVRVEWVPSVDLPFVPGIDDNPPTTATVRVERVGEVLARC